MNENKKTPKIRFKGFNDVWEQRKLNEISNRYDNLRIPVASNEREKGNIPYYGANGIQDYVKGFTHSGEFVLIAEDGANDLKNYPVKYVNGLFWANNHVHVVQGKESICNNKYLKYCFSKTNIESLLVGGGRAKLNANIMMNIDLKLPKIKEQESIGKMFYEIDNLITLHQRKWHYFFYSWEQRKLLGFAEYIDGNYGESYPKDGEFVESGVPFFTSAVTGSQGIWNYKYVKYITKEKNDTLVKAQSKGGDLVLTNRGASMGVISQIPLHYKDVNIGPQLTRIRGKENILDNLFLLSNLRTKKSYEQLLASNAGSAMPFISLTNLSNLEINFPNYDEQVKIGELFANLDNLITLHQHKEYKRRNDKNEHLR